MNGKIVMSNLGQVVITTHALHTLNYDSITKAVRQYIYGDWGITCDEDKVLNDNAVKNGERILAVYKDEVSGEKFWIITEWDRSVTTILLPEDY